MRKYLTMVTAMGLVGCRALGDAFTAHSSVVARAGDDAYTVAQMVDVLAIGQELPLRRDVVDQLARHWVDVMLIAKRAAAGDSLLDTTVVLDAMWPDVRSVLTRQFRQEVFEERVDVTPTMVDSAYRMGEMRMLAHILRRVSPESTADEKENQRLTAERLWRGLTDGGAWEDANQLNEDDVARPRNGSLGLVKRGQTVPRFENAAFALAPGEMSPVTETEFGFHIVYRPLLDEVRDAFADAIEREVAARFDSAYGEELLAAERVEVRPGAAAAVREVAGAPLRSLGWSRVLATYEHGRFTAGQFARWIPVLRQEVRQQLLDAPDDQIVHFVRQMVLEELRWHQVDSAGLRLSDSLYAAIENKYRTALDAVWMTAGIHPDSLGAAGATVPERERAGVARVENYMRALAARDVPMRPVQPFLAERLRRDMDWEIVSAGVERVLERADQLRRAANTSTPFETREPLP